jgi:SAM-dependent methyltransferase
VHASSLENMRKYHDRYVVPATAALESVSVLDVGGADVNGGYRQVFTDPRYEYRTVDIEPGEGVDIVLDDPYVLPIEDSTVDVVLSGQMLEHCEFFWLTFAEMVRVLKPSGIIVLIAPSAGPIHRFPVDCYRFYPDAYRALAKWTGCHVVELFHDERGPWNDLVGIFSRTPMAAAPPPQPRPYAPHARPPDAPGSAEEEQVRGEENYIDFLSRLHAAVRPSLYLEIGVRFGRSLALADGPAVGVDPEPDLRFDLGSGTRVWTGTSDEFFESADQNWLPVPVDLAFLDGMHLFEYVLRDFMNTERRSRPGATIVIDDVFPVHPAQAERSRRTRVWTGDVWKIDAILARYRPDLVRIRVDTDPTGLLLVVGADPENRRLWQQYNPIVRAFSEDLPVPEDVLDRADALSPTSPQVAAAVALIADRELRRPELVARLRKLLTTSQR